MAEKTYDVLDRPEVLGVLFAHYVYLPVLSLERGIPLAIVIPILVAGIFGLFNGFLVTHFRIQPLRIWRCQTDGYPWQKHRSLSHERRPCAAVVFLLVE